ncbi:MAG: hypothetical protein CK425_05010 [Parachlamydia sp.]|nr:MAG: hypothetical protein CK425_05010 [Parachlamydia sp.]
MNKGTTEAGEGAKASFPASVITFRSPIGKKEWAMTVPWAIRPSPRLCDVAPVPLVQEVNESKDQITPL